MVPLEQQPDTALPLPLKQPEIFANEEQGQSPFFLNQPGNIVVTVEYNPETGQYTVYEKIGDINVRPPRVMSEEEYRNFQFEQSMRNYWKERRMGEQSVRGSGILPRLEVGGETFDRIFGSNIIEIIPQGTAELVFGISSSRTDNPLLSEDLRRNTTFDFQSKIQMNVTGTIGEKLRMDVNYDTEATFDFENNVKVEYTGFEDEIIQKIEAGNVSLPLPGTLITGSHSLFGIKTQMKFGRLTVTSIFSKQNGESQTVEVRGGAQTKEFEVQADDYEANKHFFLSHYFYDNYNRTLQNLPVINSGVTITKVEVWLTNKQSNFDNSRDVVAFADLGENQQNIYASDIFYQINPGQNPYNEINNLYVEMTTSYQGIRTISDVNMVLGPLEAQGFAGGKDYEKIENARKLTTFEYDFEPQLGYISLNFSLNADEILAVAYEYTLGGKTYRVGELSTDGVTAPDALIVKLLKGTNLSPKMPTWNLMMKNIYSIGAYQLSSNEFYLDVLYQNDLTGTAVNYIPEGNIANKPLLQVLSLDNLNSNNDFGSDGMFDFIEKITVKPSSGRIIFPIIQPFGKDLARKIGDPDIAEKYVYQELYDSTLTKARQVAEKNKFRITGSYQSSSTSEISLNAPNVPRGSVTVTAGGRKLEEGIDFTVDYVMGTVKIIDPGLLESNTPIQISLESQSIFNFETKTLVGSHFDYMINDDFFVGATVLNLTERPYTSKVSFGNEAISNTIWGLNASYKTESALLTKAVDLLPLIETKEKSTINIDAEFAHFVPGHARAIGDAGTVYIDDFEGSKTSTDLRMWSAWKLASTPQGQNDLFPEGNLSNDIEYGFKRAKVAWYTIDPLFLRNNSLTPAHIRNDPNSQSSHFVREIFEREIFPNRNTPQGEPTNMPVLNVAYYPSEKGPYNYNVDEVNADGSLMNPKSMWAGTMRALPVTDFETANIEYIEFWLMDPFVEDSLHTGGDLYFNLGNISEDILRDGKKLFEQGLPTSSEITNVDSTAWGRVPTVSSLVNAFDSDPETRRFQDVGLDGLGGSDEASFFADYIEELHARNIVLDDENDPSNDNYRYYQSIKWDEQKTGILDRYKKYNNPEGNSNASGQPTVDGVTEPYSTSADNLPDVEDINRDNTLSDNESYYQYRISLRPQDMEIGSNFITDKVSYNAKFNNDERSTVNWYQFKVPVEEYERIVGPIEDFKSIRFMRMFLRGFSDTVILRFATLELVRGEWRKFTRALIEGQEGMPVTDLPAGTFDISTVNIEENHKREPVNYVLPPGVTRETDPTQPQLLEQNEQSMELKVLNLGDGDARAAFKNINYDIRQYRRMMMEIHAEEIPGMPLEDEEITVFIRLGTDYTNNYYEYEVPLVLTPHGSYNNGRDIDRETVWPRQNVMDIDLELFQNVKLERNDKMREANSYINLSTVYTMMDGNRKVKVAGNPSLSNIRVMMVGIRNPGRSSNPGDDGLPKSGIIWINELRLSQLQSEGGWAANARVAAKLADLAMVNVAGTTIKPGFGSLESKVSDRSLNDFYQYDVSSTISLGRFFPKDINVNLPLFIGYSESFANPEYNPLDPDIPLKTALNNATSGAERDSIKKVAQEYTRRKSVNLTNVRINKQSSKPRIYDISNFALSYSYSDQLSRNIKTDHRIQRNVRGGLTYNYNIKAKNVAPLKNVKWLSSPYLSLIRDVNFSFMPSQLSFRTELNRSYFEQQLRNINNPDIILLPTYSKDFLWNRVYSLNWDLTQALRFDFNANNIARIDEPEGMVNKNIDPGGYEQWRDSVWTNLKNMGRNTQYNHQFNLTYNIPINKIPFLSWVSSSARYTGNYNWTAKTILPDTSSFDPGNKLQNSNTVQLTGQLNFTSLYNKSGYLKGINQKFDEIARGTTKPKTLKTVTYEENDVRLRENAAKTITHNLKTDDVTVKVYDETGNDVKVEVDIRSDMRVRIRSEKEIASAKVVVEGKVPEKDNPFILIAEGTIRALMGIKNMSASYSSTNGTSVPGYRPQTQYLGLSNQSGVWAPGFPFVAGWQDPDFAWKAVDNQWLSTDTTINSPFVLSHNENLTLRTSIEPFPGFRIEVSGNRSYSSNRNEYYQADALGVFDAYNPMTTGNFSISVITLGSAFQGSNRANNYVSEAFQQFSDYRLGIAKRFARQRVPNAEFNYDPTEIDDKTGYPVGYGPYSQDVLIQAFIAAYTGKNPQDVALTPFLAIPMPNWQITYDGLAKLKFFKKYLRTFTITHSYRSTYTVGSYSTNLNYNETEDGFSYIRNIQNDFVSQQEITNISINEQLSPLISFDMGWNNSLTNRVEIRNTRTLAMSFGNNQLSETTNWEYIVGAGYRFENLPIQFISAIGDQKTLKSDLRLRLDFSLRNSKTILRKLAEETNTPTSGQRAISVKTSADYVVSEQVTIRLFFDRMLNTPLVSTSFPTANTSFGFSVRFTLAQ
ncbi:MAG TPA: cell surface protein SprA [Tenuifilaceae bacterium]|nr:cell surface protein SprA [Tenuifilaceae bacterium]HPE18925.1 cell surface protein SprA [Tenuifilaceae bacterium]HPJ46206.1 cell surface protein SprA [Tenuifilaceae bacterium]HPQ34208.1 cell surface protein SprA [Tenuifilaceae bacterium]HRX67856.1 cell surface protein SprA [Tenuifilaceae bacterium]